MSFKRSLGKDDWETPWYFFRLLNKEFQFTLDACASDSNHKVDNYFTIKQNGLKQDWKGNSVFCNPPFSKKDLWMQKCYEEGLKEHTSVVLLIPSTTETIAWHKYCMNAYIIYLVKGRVNFVGGKGNGSTFPLSVILFNGTYKFPLLRPFYHKEKDLQERGSF